VIEYGSESAKNVLLELPEIVVNGIGFLKKYALILAPIFISLLLGILTKTFFVTMLGIMVTFILIIIECIRCRKENVLRIENFHRYSWEKNFDVILGNGYVLFLLPLMPVWFICYLINIAVDDAGIILFIPIAIIVYIMCYKILVPKEKIDKTISNIDNPNNIKIKPNVSNSKIIYCVNCGSKLEESDLFCANCGTKRQ
jgi:hypothetical protein